MATVQIQLLQFICLALSHGIDVTVSEQKKCTSLDL